MHILVNMCYWHAGGLGTPMSPKVVQHARGSDGALKLAVQQLALPVMNISTREFTAAAQRNGIAHHSQVQHAAQL